MEQLDFALTVIKFTLLAAGVVGLVLYRMTR